MRTYASFTVKEIEAIQTALKESKRRGPTASARHKLDNAIAECIDENRELFPMELIGPDAYETDPDEEE